MQSFLQYTRAGHAAQAQIDRDVEKVRNLQQVEGRLEQAQSPGSPSGEVNVSSQLDESNDHPDLAPVNTVHTRHSEGTALGHVLTGIQVRDIQSGGGPKQRVFIVDWEGSDDPFKPHNWPVWRRVGVTLQISLIALFVGSASGIDATVLPQAAHSLHVSEVAESLATGLYLVGMGLGSLVAGPFSETFGRNVVYIGSMAVFMIWIMASGLAPNFGAQIVFRFLAGCSASTPLVCSGGSVADMYNSLEKTWSFPLYAITCFGGPMLGAVMGAYIGPSTVVSWRWVEWTTLISAALVLVLVMLFMPETYGPLLLQWKAAHYRAITGDDRFRSAHEVENATLFSRLRVSMTRPFLMLTEPIIIAMTLYITVVNIVLFTFLVGWPYIFERTYGLSQGLANIVFIAMFLGTQVTFVLVPLVYRKTVRQLENARSHGETIFHPEVRLWYAMYGAALAIPVSLFWLAWTSFAHISIWSAIFAVTLFGFGVTGLFLCVYMYIIDSYEIYAASALTFVALIRYVVAGGMTVVGIPFYENLGTHYTLTILGCIAAVLAPIPYILYFRGHWIRSKSRFAVNI
ncbi:major facilitator superfamily transporter [Thelonectria olida]|uniref:Major facilitator superfamily transporter n=1 Tax=Thelonectria olida TaxID=1576542 RepID=A0A9P8W3T7_9HYPO|nr:major facilitator superfamily transporter [Thelonectria olida]